MNFDTYTSPEAEELLRAAANRFDQYRANRRALIMNAAVAAAVLTAATALAVLAPWSRPLTITRLAIAIGAFVVADRVRFPVGPGWTAPTQVVVVPMLFVLPLPLVPLVVAACRVLGAGARVAQRALPPRAVFVALGDSAYVLGPALVLAIAGEQRFGWQHWELYVLAFAAQVVFDVASGFGRAWFEERIPLSQLMPMSWIYATDASLSCAGLLIAASAQARPGLILLALPLIGLLGLFARERTERMENTLALSTAYRGTALLLGDVIEDDDEYTGVHSRAVVDLSVAVAGRLRLDASARRNVEFGALLHDVGKIRVPKEIIHKPGKLNDAEWAIMREHTVYGEQMLSQVGGTLSSVGKVVRHSHERWDGTGYPDGLVAEAIPIEARIICACDAFNAMTTHRPYRKAMSIEEATAELIRCSGSHFDPKVVAALLAEFADHPPAVSPPPIAPVAAPVRAQARVDAPPDTNLSALAST
jgi:HD-GYP domain-containing protein (c-di-GMP phosphodiesterase class II)